MSIQTAMPLCANECVQLARHSEYRLGGISIKINRINSLLLWNTGMALVGAVASVDSGNCVATAAAGGGWYI